VVVCGVVPRVFVCDLFRKVVLRIDVCGVVLVVWSFVVLCRFKGG